MHKILKFLSFSIPLAAVLLACGPVAESQARGSGNVPAGMDEIGLNVGGENKSFLVYEPASRSSKPGLVLALHGGRAGAADFVGNTRSLLTYADREGFVAIYPDAGGNWNDGRANFAGQPSDVTYIRAVVDWAAKNLNIDRSRVFVLGASNGGTMAYKLACDAPDLVAGIAPIIASFNATQFSKCRPGQSTPVVIINGTADPLMVYDGGQSTSRLASFAPQDDTIVSTPQTAAFWARNNGCGSNPSTENLPERDRSDGTTVTLIKYSCPRDQVWLYRVNGGGHTIPGGVQRGRIATRLVGPTSREIDAVGSAISFFGRYGL